MKHRAVSGLVLMLLLMAQPALAEVPDAVLLITIDTLRADRLSCYGYERPTSPNIDALLARGARFTQARTVEPLTNPALASMLTSLPPHVHGATRNGLRMKPGLASMTKALRDEGWMTAAFVSSWTLKDKISRMAEHFEHYETVLTRRRWFGMINREATAEDVTDRAISWLDAQRKRRDPRPLLLWAHYVEPHAPYRLHRDHAERLGVPRQGASKSDRYDTEVAFNDAEVGRLVDEAEERFGRANLLVVFTADHGESLGEHGYWGHGRQLYEPMLRIPLGVILPGRVPPGVVEAPVVITDLAPTILEFLGIDAPEGFTGRSLVGLLSRGDEASAGSQCFETHRGAVKGNRDSERARTRGLISVAVVEDKHKEILEMRTGVRHLFDLEADPGELESLVAGDSDPSEAALTCLGEVAEGLEAADRAIPAKVLDAESRAKLKALGYLED